MKSKTLEANKIISGESGGITPCSPNATVTCPFSSKKTMTSIFMACLSVFLLVGCTDNSDQTRQRSLKQVSVITIEPKIIAMPNELPGRVKAFKTAEIRPQVSGIIQSRFFEEGSLVEEGQQLYQIDPAKYEADYQSKNASLQNIKAERELALALESRYRNLIKTNAVSEQEFDSAKASVAQAEAAVSLARAEVKTAKINLDYTKVYAPISGYISPSTVTDGALVTAQQQAALATIRQLDPVYVDLSQSAADAKTLQLSLMTRGEDAKFEVTLLFGNNDFIYPHKGSLYATDLAVDENTGTVRLRSVFPNPNAALLPGMFVRATIDKMEIQETIIVPQKAVSIEADGSKAVWIVDVNNIASKRAVVTNSTYKNNWVIKSGLKTGDTVIVAGTMMLQPGSKVVPKNINSEVSNNISSEATKSDDHATADAENNKTSSN
ncbi:MAG: RND family efflux transporter MFP subunit [Gammaproteobacteria bacterium]|jgi:RND family efflux transporter MFP subunit